MYGTLAKRAKKLRRRLRVPLLRGNVLPPATRAAMDDAENDRTEAVSLDELKAQMDAIC